MRDGTWGVGGAELMAKFNISKALPDFPDDID